VPKCRKSTLLSVVTNAKPKVPHIHLQHSNLIWVVAILDDDKSLVLADIPGLIEGAHLGLGLGHDFLRHIQRTRVLIHLIDGMSEDPFLDLCKSIASWHYLMNI